MIPGMAGGGDKAADAGGGDGEPTEEEIAVSSTLSTNEFSSHF